ncbi:hypothetical protein, partial [Gelidibacter salicanalis]|uniref:hypothetical protein n=1 Tax=Gelidibacter salicanalis TaxID=291193 RepID=UPI001F23D0FE
MAPSNNFTSPELSLSPPQSVSANFFEPLLPIAVTVFKNEWIIIFFKRKTGRVINELYHQFSTLR